MKFPFAFVSLALSLVGCMTIPSKVVPPKIELASLRMEDPTLTATTLILGLRVENPNDFGIDVSRLDYALKLNQQDVGAGASTKAIHLPKNDQTTVELPVRVPYTKLFEMLQSFGRNHKLDYSLTGNAEVHGRVLPFVLKGQTELPNSR